MLPGELFLGIHMYGLMIGVGIVCCFLLLMYFFKKMNIKVKFSDFIFYNGIASIVFGFFSASFFQSFYNFLEDPSAGFVLGENITFLGGLIGGAACFLLVYLIFRNKYENKLIDVLTIIPIGITAAHGFGRVGCFFAGCCHGIPTDSIFGVQFPKFGYKVFPTQIYEALFLFILCGVMCLLFIKKKYQYNMSLYMLCYGIFRFFLEYLRGDDRGSLIPGLTPSQFLSVLMVIASVGIYFLTKYLLKRRAVQLACAEEKKGPEEVPVEAVEADEN